MKFRLLKSNYCI